VACTESPSHSRRPGNKPIRVKVRVSFTTGAVRLAILATAALLVELCDQTIRQILITVFRTPPEGEVMKQLIEIHQ